MLRRPHRRQPRSLLADDLAQVIRRGTDRSSASAALPTVSGWSSVPTKRRREGFRRHLPILLLLIPLVLGLLGSPAGTSVVNADELADAKAKQAQLKKEIAAQKAQVAQLADLQSSLAAEIRATRTELRGINADLTVVRTKIVKMETRIDQVKAAYSALVYQLGFMNQELGRIQAQETLKRQELSDRRALLADRVRNAYDTDRTSPLETFVSGGTFTDLLAEMSYYIDIGEQDQALAVQINRDKETLAAIHETVAQTRSRTDDLRVDTAAQKRTLDASLKDLNETKAELKILERRTAKALNEQRARFAAVARSKASAARIIRQAAAHQRALAGKIKKLIAAQVKRGQIPSKFNGTLGWPMSGAMSQNYGCTGFAWEPPRGSCAHFHSGIDLVAPSGTPVRASAGGTVAYIGWNWADGTDPAWIVVIAHSQGLQTWYAHMQPTSPGGIAVGSSVRKGQVIGFEGSTGHSTGAHLHWAVMLNGEFVNPRLFL